MKRQLVPTFAVLCGLAALMLMNTPSARSFPDNTADKSQAAGKLLRHVVMFKFKDEATPKQIDAVVKGFSELPEKIDVIQDYEWGTNNSPEDHDHGYTHCFLVTFKSEADRDAYLPHPAHQAFVKVLLPILDQVQVVDYWAHH